MFRDFSQEAKEKLISYVNDTSSDGIWQIIKNSIDYMDVKIKNWLHTLDSYAYLSQMDGYYQTVLNKHDTTIEQIEQIFTAVEHVDTAYLKHGAEMNTCAEKIIKLMNTLAQTIDPAGGNLDMASQKGVLDAAVADLKDAQATVEKEIQEELLGTDAAGTNYCGDPVNMTTGNFVYDREDLVVGGEINLSFHRYYNSKDDTTGTIGKSFRHNYEISLEKKTEISACIHMYDGQCLYFEKENDGSYKGTGTALEILFENEEGYRLCRAGLDSMQFDKMGKLVRAEDINGRGITFSYNESGLLETACADNGNIFSYYYNEKNLLVRVEDQSGRKILLTYKENLLETVTLPDGGVYQYQYGVDGRISHVENAGGVTTICNDYDNKHRITRQKFPDGGVMEFLYDDVKKRVICTERNGQKIIYVHDNLYRHTETLYEDGTREEYIYNDKNQCVCVTDRNKNRRRMAYDNRGNLTQVTDEAKRRINMTYDANNHLLNVSINGKARLKHYYDAHGNLVCTENADGAIVKIENDKAGRPTTVVQPDGSEVAFTYDERGNIICIKKATGGVEKYQYDNLNRVIKTVDGNGNETSYQYDVADRIVSVKNANGDTRTYQYNKNGNLTEICDYDGYTLKAKYNGIGQLEYLIDKEGAATKYLYDKMWNISSIIMPDKAVYNYIYNKENQLKEEVLPYGSTIKYNYDALGNCIAVTDAEGNVTSYTYDCANRIIEVLDSDGERTSFTYDKDGNLITIVNALGDITSYTYDEMGRRNSVTDVEGNTTSVYYNKMDQVQRICYPNGSSTEYLYEKGGRLHKIQYPDGAVEIYTYDNEDNLIQRTNALGECVQMKYDRLNRLTDLINPAGGVRHYSYDAVGNVVEMIDENGNRTSYEYSPNGDLTCVTDALNNRTYYTYDKVGNLLQIKRTGEQGESDSVTDYKWDLQGNVIQIKDPLGAVEYFSYDKNGRMAAKTDRDGCVTNYKYNPTGQISEIVYADGQKVKLSYNALRQLEEMKDWIGSTRIRLDKMGRPLSVTDADGQKVSYEWNNMGEKTKIVYPDGNEVHYTYNIANQLIQLENETGVITYDYDEMGRFKTKHLPNDVVTSYSYNNIGRIAKITHHDQEKIIDSYDYTYDNAGNKITVDQKRSGTGIQNVSYTYGYDAVNRLIHVSREKERLREYTYDAFGNRIEKKDFENESIIRYSYNANNQLISETGNLLEKTYQYDQRGNIRKICEDGKVLKEFTFDCTNRLKKVQKFENGITDIAEYAYNGLGQRVRQQISGKKDIHYTLDLTRKYHNLLQSNEQHSGRRQQFFWDGKAAGMLENGKSTYYLQDDHGSTMCMVDMQREIDALYAYDEFGMPVYKNEKYTQPFGYTGYQMDEISELYFAQARRYDSRTGRFVSEDLIKGFPEMPFTLNPYIYCWDRPEDFEDNDGEWPTVVIGALVGGIVSGVIETGSQMVGAIQNGEKIDIDWGKVGLEAAKGVVKGAIAGTGAGLLVTAASNGLIDSTANAIEQKFIEGKQNIDVGEVVETGVWSAGTTLVFGGLDKAVDKVKSGIGWDKAVKQLRDEKGISAWMEKRRISTEKIKLREKRSLSDIIHGRNQPHKKEYTKILNDLNVRVGVLKSKTKWDRISGNVCRSARKRATEHLGRKEALKYMIINYSGQKLVGGVKDKIKNSIRNNLYLSNLKDAVDIDGHVNQFICAFT